jgi:sigma-E factor negative regulatory protein RseC
MEHPGIVTEVKEGFVTVQIESTSACAACQAHARCGFAESKTKTLDIPIDDNLNDNFNVGDRVTVTIDHSRGLLATWWAYVLPAVLLLGAVVGFTLAELPEPTVILLSLAILGLYILILYLFRKKLDSRFTLKISPVN